jgi:hypothetical protein
MELLKSFQNTVCLLGHGQHFSSECHFPQEKHDFAKLYYIAHFEGHEKAQG